MIPRHEPAPKCRTGTSTSYASAPLRKSGSCSRFSDEHGAEGTSSTLPSSSHLARFSPEQVSQTMQDTLKTAFAFHQAGQLNSAVSLYHQVLAHDSENADA